MPEKPANSENRSVEESTSAAEHGADLNSARVRFQPEMMSPHDQLVQQMAINNAPESEIAALGDPIADAKNGGPTEPEIYRRVQAALKTIYDPEIPVNIYDLGLIYRIAVTGRLVEVDMTLTAPGCPVAHTFPGMVEATVKLVPGVEDAIVELVWEPPWRKELISEAAQLELGIM